LLTGQETGLGEKLLAGIRVAKQKGINTFGLNVLKYFMSYSKEIFILGLG
jgi:hypothetical protein